MVTMPPNNNLRFVWYDMLPKSDENRNKIAAIRVVLIVLFLIYVDLAVTAVIKLF